MSAALRRATAASVALMSALLLAPGTASATVFANNSPITIPTQGNASPYPSSIEVSGLAGPITDVNVTLLRFGHNNPADVDILLVSPNGDALVPNGDASIVMSELCGGTDIEDNIWTFDAQSGNQMLPPCDAFVYRPDNRNATPDFTGAPPGPYAADFNRFNGENPNGTWRLFVRDTAASNAGDIELGWAIAIETGPVDATVPGAGSSGVANPYPITLAVSGGELITDLNVIVEGISHQRPDDLDLLLVGPHGEKVVLMSDACGTFDANFDAVRFDDEAPAPLPDNAGTNACHSLNATPTDYEPGDAWPAPAPAGPYDTSLSAFDLTDPNGNWSLYVNDDADGEAGWFTDRFRLELETRPRAGVAFTQSAVELAEGATRELTVVRSAPAPLGPGAVTVSTVPGSARSGSDFTPVSTTVQFAAGQTERTVPITALTDVQQEPDEAFAVAIGSPTGDAAPATPSTVAVTIPATAAGPGGGDGAGGGDLTPASLTRYRLSRSTFAAGSSGPSVAAARTRRKPRIGTRVRYRLSEPATVRFTVERARSGRRVGGRCVKPTRRNRRGKRCTRYPRLRASFTHTGRLGSNSAKFSGRLRGRKLRPGRYRLVATATDAAGNRSRPSRVTFRIVKR